MVVVVVRRSGVAVVAAVPVVIHWGLNVAGHGIVAHVARRGASAIARVSVVQWRDAGMVVVVEVHVVMVVMVVGREKVIGRWELGLDRRTNSSDGALEVRVRVAH